MSVEILYYRRLYAYQRVRKPIYIREALWLLFYLKEGVAKFTGNKSERIICKIDLIVQVPGHKLNSKLLLCTHRKTPKPVGEEDFCSILQG